MNTYTKLIAEGLRIEASEALKIQNFINCLYDDFRWGSSSILKILRTAKQAQEDMKDPIFSDFIKENC